MTVYRIAKWSSVFERAESRKLKVLTWVSIPTSFSSHGYQSLLDDFGDDAAAIYGAWCALVSAAASCTVRGVLANSRGAPLPMSHLVRMTGFPQSVFEQLINWASRPDIGWLEVVSDTDSLTLFANPQGNTDFSGLTGESPDDPPTRRGNPPTTRPDQTRPDPTRQDDDRQDQTGPDPPGGRRVVESSSSILKKVEGQSVVEAANQLLRVRSGTLSSDLDWLWRLCWVALSLDESLPSRFAVDLEERRGEERIRKPRQYLEGAIRTACEERGESWHDLSRDVPPRPVTRVDDAGT